MTAEHDDLRRKNGRKKRKVGELCWVPDWQHNAYSDSGYAPGEQYEIVAMDDVNGFLRHPVTGALRLAAREHMYDSKILAERIGRHQHMLNTKAVIKRKELLARDTLDRLRTLYNELDVVAADIFRLDGKRVTKRKRSFGL